MKGLVGQLHRQELEVSSSNNWLILIYSWYLHCLLGVCIIQLKRIRLLIFLYFCLFCDKNYAL